MTVCIGVYTHRLDESMGSSSGILNKWAILCVQDPVFLESVKIAYVFNNGNQAVLVSRNDDVYTIGKCGIHTVCIYVSYCEC